MGELANIIIREKLYSSMNNLESKIDSALSSKQKNDFKRLKADLDKLTKKNLPPTDPYYKKEMQRLLNLRKSIFDSANPRQRQLLEQKENLSSRLGSLV